MNDTNSTYIYSCIILFVSDFRCRDGNLCWLGLLALLPLSHVDRNFSHTFPMLTPWANSFVSAKLPRFFPRQATTTDQSGKAEEAKTKFAKCCLQCIRQHHGCSHAVKFSIGTFFQLKIVFHKECSTQKLDTAHLKHWLHPCGKTGLNISDLSRCIGW